MGRYLGLGMAFAMAALAGAPSAQAKELVYSIIGAPKHIYNVKVVGGWAKAVEEATKGQVTVKVLPASAAPPARLYDAVRTRSTAFSRRTRR